MVPFGASSRCVEQLIARAVKKKLQRRNRIEMPFRSPNFSTSRSSYSSNLFFLFLASLSLSLSPPPLLPPTNTRNAGKKPSSSSLEVEKEAPPKDAAGKGGAPSSTVPTAAAEADEAASSSTSPADAAANAPTILPATYLQLARDFALLGWTAFGGPSAHVAQFVLLFTEKGKRRWLTTSVFAELFALAQCVPGPSSTQLAYG